MGRRGAKPEIWLEEGICTSCAGRAYIFKMILWRFHVSLIIHLKGKNRNNNKKDLFYIG